MENKEIKFYGILTKKEFRKYVECKDIEKFVACIWSDEDGEYIEIYAILHDGYDTMVYSDNDIIENLKSPLKKITKKYKKWIEDETNIDFEIIEDIVTV